MLPPAATKNRESSPTHLVTGEIMLIPNPEICRATLENS